MLGIGFGFFPAWLIARTAEWKTIVTTVSVVIAFGVSVLVGVVFGIYPAMKASEISPIEALRYKQRRRFHRLATMTFVGP